MPGDPLAEVVVKFAILNALWVPVHLVWLWAGISLKRLDLSPAAQSVINKLMAVSLMIVVILAALSAR